MLQATHTGFGDITADAVFKVCDQPHPVLVRSMLADCAAANLAEAYKGMKALCDMGYSPIDIITTVYRVRTQRRCCSMGGGAGADLPVFLCGAACWSGAAVLLLKLLCCPALLQCLPSVMLRWATLTLLLMRNGPSLALRLPQLAPAWLKHKELQRCAEPPLTS